MTAYTVDPETGCWVWNGTTNSKGYALLWSGKITISAYRASYLLHKGPIPDGMQIDHLCRNRRCVNPDHLEAVTPEENMRRSTRTKLTVEQVNEIRRMLGTATHAEIAEQFGVSQPLVSQIALGRIWTEGEGLVPAPDWYSYKRKRLSYADAEEIRRLTKEMPQKEIAERYGVARSLISLIVRGKRWARPLGNGHVTPPPTSRP